MVVVDPSTNRLLVNRVPLIVAEGAMMLVVAFKVETFERYLPLMSIVDPLDVSILLTETVPLAVMLLIFDKLQPLKLKLVSAVFRTPVEIATVPADSVPCPISRDPAVTAPSTSM